MENNEIESIREFYRKDLKFSRYHLDDACETQADLFDNWHQQYVDALADLEVEKRSLSEKRAELDSRLRKAIAKDDKAVIEAEFKCYKSTEAAIALAVEGHKEIKKIQLCLAEATYQLNTLRGATEAFQQRKSMIQQMCQLFITGYFGDVDSVRMREVDEKLAKTSKVPEARRSPDAAGRRRRTIKQGV